jgi:hypothetical protein
MIIKAGKRYITRSFDITHPLERIGDGLYCYDTGMYRVTQHGRYHPSCDHPNDLIKEYGYEYPRATVKPVHAKNGREKKFSWKKEKVLL